MIKTKTRSHMMLLIGILLTIGSILLASFAHYNHFYEFLVVGLFLILHWLLGTRIRRNIYIHLYYIFVLAGFIGDYIFGVKSGLWHYNYTNFGDYVVLYGLIYPLAGIVMVQSYVAVRLLLMRARNPGRKKYLVNKSGYKVAITAILGCLLVLLLYQANHSSLRLTVTIYIFSGNLCVW